MTIKSQSYFDVPASGVRLERNKLSMIMVGIFIFYGAAILSKYLSYRVLNFSLFSELLLVINLVELIIWARVSRIYYSKQRAYIGLMLFYSSFATYATVPLALLSFDVPIFPFDQDTIRGVMFGQSLSLTHVFLFTHILITPTLVAKVDKIVDKYLSELKPNKFGEIAASLIGLIIAFIYFYNFSTSGAAEMVGATSRAMIANAAETGKTWLLQYLFFAWLMTVAMVSMSRQDQVRSGWLARGIQILAIMVFMYAYISIGNRRELALLLMFLLVLSIFRKKRLLFAITAISFPILLALGLFRVLGGLDVGDYDLKTNMLNLFGEFVFPHYPLMYYSDRVITEYQLGATYLNLPLYVLPSFDLWEKAQSLAVQFSNEYSGRSMGYALTPLTEGYINFGWISVVLVPLMLVFTFRVMFRAARVAPFGILVLLSFPLDISRGEFTTIAFQWIIFTFAVALIVKIYTNPVFRGVR